MTELTLYRFTNGLPGEYPGVAYNGGRLVLLLGTEGDHREPRWKRLSGAQRVAVQDAGLDPDSGLVGYWCNRAGVAEVNAVDPDADIRAMTTVEDLRLVALQTREQHRADVAKISQVLIDEANERGWCDEYDQIVGNDINPHLHVKMRHRGIELCTRFTYTTERGTFDEHTNIRVEHGETREAATLRWAREHYGDDATVGRVRACDQ